jgi:hypothetical protein
VVDVRVQEEAELSERIFGTVNPLLGSAVGLVGLVVVGLFLLLIARATSRQGSRDEYDWNDGFDHDEYEDEYDDEFDDEDDEDDVPIPAAATAATMTTKAEEASTSTDGWTKGADGTWWYHDPKDGSWWYRGADGVDRRHG